MTIVAEVTVGYQDQQDSSSPGRHRCSRFLRFLAHPHLPLA